MKTTIKTTLTAILFLAISCKKENNTIHALSVTDKSLMDVTTEITAQYSSVKIGAQKWMNRNLDVTRYRNGDKIKQVKDLATWASLTTGAWCYYNNDTAIGAVYGKLYNWYAVNDLRGLAPAGYHIPSDAEWTTLSTFLGGDAGAGGKMKEVGIIHWSFPNILASDSSHFTGLPGGNRAFSGVYNNIYNTGYWWSSTQNSSNSAWYRFLSYNLAGIYRFGTGKQNGFSVRCIKD